MTDTTTKTAATRQPVRAIDPICAECGKLAKHAFGADVWPGRRDLYDVPVFKCECGAWVGCHRGTDIPLGFPAGSALRDLRQRGHHAFDRIWNAKMRLQGVAKGRARSAAYKWLGEQLGIEPADCHFGHFDKATCLRAIAICEPWAAKMQALEIEAMHRRREATKPATPPEAF